MDTEPTLFLIPTPLAPGEASWLGTVERASLAPLTVYLVENERTARRFIGSLGFPRPVSALSFIRFDKDASLSDARQILASLPPESSAGVLSEAGAPCIADPGALLVRAAHERGMKVRPLIGPSAIMLALMASGLNGQRFTFHGYPPVEEGACQKWIKTIEETSRGQNATQLWIETPYRTRRMAAILTATIADDTLISIAQDIGGPHESIQTLRGSHRHTLSPLHPKAPAVFGLLRGTWD
jgi:16S rRNA (cytidine1402-2'-O)-methyltransferase